MQRDLFGDQIPIQYAVDLCRQPELFTPSGGTGSAWIAAAEAWASSHGLTVVRWWSDQRFQVSPGGTFRAIWPEDADRWDFVPDIAD
jgi:hypothetical protein